MFDLFSPLFWQMLAVIGICICTSIFLWLVCRVGDQDGEE